MLVAIACGIVSFWLYVIWYSVTDMRERRRRNEPPGAYQVPYFGGAISIIVTTGVRGPSYKQGHRISQKFGPIAGFRLGEINAAITDDYETVKAVLNSPDWSVRLPRNVPMFNEQTLSKDLGLLFGHSESHREMRKFTFRTFRAVGFGELKQAEQFFEEELTEFLSTMNFLIKSSDNSTLYIRHTFKIPSFNIIWRFLANSRFSYDDVKIHRLIEAVDDVASINFARDPELYFPLLRFVPGCSPTRAKRQSFITCHEFFIDIMNERRKLGDYKKFQADFIDHILFKIDSENGNRPEIYCDEQVYITCRDLLFGGLDTTSNSLEFALIYMTLYPHIQKKVQDEIDSVIGTNRLPRVTDRPHLRYCEATLLETLRFANIAPLIGRTSACDTTLGSYNVKKDTICVLNITMVHMNPELWGDPQNFRPERFLDKNNNIVNAEKVLAFGGGQRQCPGYTQGKVIWLAFFAATFQHFTFEPSPIHDLPSVVPDQGITNTAKPFHCVVKPRFEK